jgi:hypothetical protein
MSKGMWEILVPTERRSAPGKFYTTRFHRVWDGKVREITGGLTVMVPARGQWVNPVTGQLFQERMIPVRIIATREEIEQMIPVRIIATREEIEQVVDLTLKYYDQIAVLCYKISDEVILKYKD